MPLVSSNEKQSVRLSFLPTEHYGDDIWVKQIDFGQKGINVPFQSTYFQVAPGAKTPIDRHQVQECWLILQGQGVLSVDGEDLAVKAQDIVHFQSFQGHSIYNTADTPLLICSIYW